jgi:hypothetical protein
MKGQDMKSLIVASENTIQQVTVRSAYGLSFPATIEINLATPEERKNIKVYHMQLS